MTSPNTLILFTSSFPFGKGEQFLESELPILSKRFKKVVLVPFWPDGPQRATPENCVIEPLAERFELRGRFRTLLLKYAGTLLSSIYTLLVKSPQRLFYLKNFRKTITDLTITLAEGDMYFKILEAHLNTSSVLYFYWFDKPFLHFAFLKKRGIINHSLVSRGLGYDYDPIRNETGFFMYREIELQQLDKLVLNSEWGKRLMSNLYPSFRSKFERAYLGLLDHTFINPINESGIFQLVSCSYVIDTKRVELIVDILHHINFPLHWTHLGEGPMLEEIKLKAQSLPANISTHFPGYVDSVMEYYKSTPVDLFLTTTYTEGLPFTFMESISFGIPVMGTQVCGIPEVANTQTGFLFPQTFDPKEVADQITVYKNWTPNNKLALRDSARNFFEKTFVSEKNTNEFIDNFLLS